MPNALIRDPTTQLPADFSAGFLAPMGEIDGLELSWVSAASISVSSGSCYIPSLGYVVQSNSTVTLTGLTTTASTWYHVYLFMSGTTPTIECVTTAPAAPYSGVARAKTGDTSRRYLGSVRSLAANTLMKFSQCGNKVSWYENIQNTNLLLVSAGTATTATTLSCTSGVPVTAKLATLSLYNSSTTSVVWLNNADCNFALGIGGNFLQIVGQQASFGGDFPISAAYGINYMYNATTGSGVNISICGYVYER